MGENSVLASDGIKDLHESGSFDEFEIMLWAEVIYRYRERERERERCGHEGFGFCG